MGVDFSEAVSAVFRCDCGSPDCKETLWTTGEDRDATMDEAETYGWERNDDADEWYAPGHAPISAPADAADSKGDENE